MAKTATTTTTLINFHVFLWRISLYLFCLKFYRFSKSSPFWSTVCVHWVLVSGHFNCVLISSWQTYCQLKENDVIYQHHSRCITGRRDALLLKSKVKVTRLWTLLPLCVCARRSDCLVLLGFYPRNAMLVRVYAVAVLCVCVSHTCFVSKRLNILSKFFTAW